MVSKKVPATSGDFDFIFQNTPDFETLSPIFFPIEKIFRRFSKNKKFIYCIFAIKKKWGKFKFIKAER